MEITVLMDNSTFIDMYFHAEPAVSMYIVDGEKKILFDTGYTGAFKDNAESMGIDISDVDTIVFSHGHNDHTGGTRYLFKEITDDVTVVAHPLAKNRKIYNGIDVGMPVPYNRYPRNFHAEETADVKQISDNIYFLGEIPRAIQPLRKLGNDSLLDDTAIVYDGKNGLVLITGCSHSGICNIIEKTKKVTGKTHFQAIIGGFHLLGDEKLTNEVCKYFETVDVDVLYPSHCTDLNAKIALSKVKNVKEVGVSLTLNFD